MGAKVESAEELRDQGNIAVQQQEWNHAIERYTEALQLCTESDKQLRVTLYRNRALARLKNEDFEGAEDDASKAVEADGADVKALFRRALAREELEKIPGAFTDAKEALRLSPKDKNVTELLKRLMIKNNELVKKATSLDSKVADMQKLAFEGGAKDLEQKRKAMANLLVLARDSESGAQRVWNGGKIVSVLTKIYSTKEEDEEVAVMAVRVLDELCKNHSRAMHFLAMHDKEEIKSVRFVCRIMCARPVVEFVDSAGLIVQRVFNAMVKMDRQKEMKPDPEVAEMNKLWIIRIILELQEMLTDKTVGPKVRNTVIDLFTKNLMHMDGGVPRGWSWKFTEDRGLLTLLDVATQIPEMCDYLVDHETRQHMSICLSRLYDDMVFDTKRTIFKERLDGFFNALMRENNEPRIQVKLGCLLITMLQGPVDVGLNMVTNDEVTAMMLHMADSNDKLLQSVAAELIVMTVSKHERATTMLKVGVPILRKLYDSEDENVRVRALVGLCKCAAAGGDDISKATMKEGAALKLASTCKKFLLETDKYSAEVRRFACEGLSYLSLDADVKEWIVEDPLLLRAMLALAKTAGPLCVFTLGSIYANLTNSYEKPKADDKLVELAKFSKHHVPEAHTLDAEKYVRARARALVDEGAVSACVAVHKTESKAAMELLARAMLAFAEDEKLRGRIISEGGTKLCLHLYKNANPEGQIKAAHCLAKLGAKADPSIAFAGQRAYEVVKPLVDLLHPDIEGKPNYDALITLTNLAAMSDSVRKKILKERAVPKIEEYWFMTDHDHLRAAASELLLNLLFCEEFFNETVKPGTDRLKLWALYCVEEDDEYRLARASAGGFAVLTEDEGACKRIISELKSWQDLFKDMIMHEDPEIQRRCLIGIRNIMQSDKALCAEIVASEIFRVLIAITKLGKNNADRLGSVEEAKKALQVAEEFDFIKATDREMFERVNNLNTVEEE
ncbi:unnamed protein product, partial [Mesorhabditis belari]|uniref:UNC-45/Cro1/She4 central domain-containing protein n=1 Tax=Mesorhabditis belari TaxID=2138241 RepID=A0AAF3EVC6_9BILA